MRSTDQVGMKWLTSSLLPTTLIAIFIIAHPVRAGEAGAAIEAAAESAYVAVLDGSGNRYFIKTGSCSINRIDAVTGLVSRFAGTGVPGYSGDGGPAGSAQFFFPYELEYDNNNGILIRDILNMRVRRIDLGTGIITTIAGNGSAPPYGGSRAPEVPIPLNQDVDSAGSFYVIE